MLIINPVFWIRNDLFQIQLLIYRVLDPDPTHVSLEYLEIIKKYRTT